MLGRVWWGVGVLERKEWNEEEKLFFNSVKKNDSYGKNKKSPKPPAIRQIQSSPLPTFPKQTHKTRKKGKKKKKGEEKKNR